MSCFSEPGGSDAPGEVVFAVHVAGSAGTLTDGGAFTLLAF